MRRRCTAPRSAGYKNYGGRGIRVCKRWDKFENFLADMGERPDGMTLDRKDNNGNYTPSNCRWATRKEQNNNSRNNVRLTHGGETKTLTEWAEHAGITVAGMWNRVARKGWPLAVTSTRPWKRRS